MTNDFPPRPGGIQAFLHSMALRLDPRQVVVYASTWKRDAEGLRASAEFDAERWSEDLAALPEVDDGSEDPDDDATAFSMPVELLAPLWQTLGVLDDYRRLRGLAEFREVGARDPGAARAQDHGGLGPHVGGKVARRVHQALPHGMARGVHRRVVDGDQADAALAGIGNGHLGKPLSHSGCRTRRARRRPRPAVAGGRRSRAAR